MTAIYAVWNNYGFSLASDSNQSASRDNQVWIDPVDKILMLEHHQIAIGGSGAALLQGVEVNELFKSWEKTLPSEGFPRLDTYFVHFASWYRDQKLPQNSDSEDEFTSEATYWLEDIKEAIDGDLSDAMWIQERYLSHATDSRTLLNLFGDGWSLLGDYAETEDSKIGHKYSAMQNVYEQYKEHAQMLGKSKTPQIRDHIDFLGVLEPLLRGCFEQVFDEEYDEDNSAHQTIFQLAILMMDNKCIFTSPVKFIMIGYGSDEWMPTGIVFEASPTFFGIPRMNIWDYSDPSSNWYLAIAIQSAVPQLMYGQSTEHAYNVRQLAEQYMEQDAALEFESQLQEINRQKFHKSLEKIESLTLGRLEFVSRLFVQIEALKSFLDQPVPGVGGDIQVITMSKTTRKQKYYRELE